VEVSKIIYYTRVDGKSKTVSLKELNLREEYYLEDIFYAVKEAIDADDLLNRFKRIISDDVELDAEYTKYLRFIITDLTGNKNYLKFKID
jgi:hypothetical protein